MITTSYRLVILANVFALLAPPKKAKPAQEPQSQVQPAPRKQSRKSVIRLDPVRTIEFDPASARPELSAIEEDVTIELLEIVEEQLKLADKSSIGSALDRQGEAKLLRIIKELGYNERTMQRTEANGKDDSERYYLERVRLESELRTAFTGVKRQVIDKTLRQLKSSVYDDALISTQVAIATAAPHDKRRVTSRTVLDKTLSYQTHVHRRSAWLTTRDETRPKAKK